MFGRAMPLIVGVWQSDVWWEGAVSRAKISQVQKSDFGGARTPSISSTIDNASTYYSIIDPTIAIAATPISRSKSIGRVNPATTSISAQQINSKMASTEPPITQQEIISTYRQMTSEMQSLIQQLTKAEMERNEHRYVR